MEPFAFYLLVIVSVTVALWEFKRRAGYLQLPFLFSAAYLGWVLPQLWLIRATHTYYADDLVMLYLMCVMCLVTTVLGWSMGQRSLNKGSQLYRPSDNRPGTPSWQWLRRFLLSPPSH